MAGAEDWGAVPVSPQPNDPTAWGAVPVEPKAPDVSGVAKMAQDNLSANDNKPVKEGDQKLPPSPMDRVSTAAGLPVDKIINGSAQPSDVNAANRVQYTKALSNGSADNSSDWTQTALHAIGHVTEIGAAAQAGGARALGTLAYPFLSDENRQKLINSGLLGEAPEPTGNTAHDIAATFLTRANAIASPITGAAWTLPASLLAPVFNPLLEKAQPTAEKAGLSPESANLVPSGIEFGMNVLGLGGFHILREATAAKLGKPEASVTPQDVNQVIAEGSKNLHPSNTEFKTVSTATGIPEQGLKTVYNDAGVFPEKILTDSQQNPQIAADVAAGKVPEQYENRVEQRQFPTEQAEKLHVTRDEATRSFSVVDRDGDHVQGGFDSYEEAQQHIEDKQYEAEERAAIEAEGKTAPIIDKTPAGEQTVIPGAEKISDKELAERKMEEPLREAIAQKAANEGLFDVAGRSQQDMFSPKSTILPSETGKPTSLRSFLNNNGAKFSENNELVSLKKNGERVTGETALEHATTIAKEHGYLPQDNPNEPSKGNLELQNLLTDKNGGREAFRDKDIDRVLAAKENKESKLWRDPDYIENQAHNAGIDTTPIKDETVKQRTARLLKELKDFYNEEVGATPINLYRRILGDSIIAVEKFAGKLTGGLFQKLADGYIRTFQPELMGDKALRADAYLAKFKAKIQEAENSYYRTSAAEIKRFDKMTEDERREWRYDHETGRWNEEDNADHARQQAMYDAMHKEEKDAGVGTDAYKQNYLPHQYEKPDAVNAFFHSEAMIKKYGNGWFNKASVFRLTQEAEKAGFKLKTDNPERMLLARQQASYNLIAHADLLHDLKESGVATRATDFTVDKRIAKTKQAIADIQAKYKTEFEAIKNQAKLTDESGNAIGEPISKKMLGVQERLDNLNKRLDDFTKEKADNKLTPDQMKELKTGLRIIGPDSKAWNIHPEAAPIWRNAMEMKGLWDKQGSLGDSYRGYMAAKAVYVRSKMLASLWHPIHEIVIDTSSNAATVAEHLIQGGKLSDLTAKDIPGRIGLTKNTFKLQDHPQIVSWKTPSELRTPEQKADVQRMTEGGFVPTIPAQDAVRFRENIDKAINGIGKNNLRLLGTLLEIPSIPMAPLMEHWIPGMKTDSYFQRTELALKRDPSLANNAGKRSEVFRQIAQDIERNYGEMNRNTLFWNPVFKDAFNAAAFSGGWKLAMLQNMRGLAEPAKVAYNWAKTGEFSKEQVTHQMLQSYIYTANMLAMGAGLTYLFTGTVGSIKDWINPPTGDKNPDGTPVRLRQPAFFNEPMMLMHDIISNGVVAGTGEFLYHQTLVPGIIDSLLFRDFVGRPYLADPTDLQQWKNMGWDSINPIVISNTQKAEQEGSHTAKIMGWMGFPIAGQWVNQTPFEQKVIAKYFEQNPSKDTALQAKLKAEMKGAVISHDTKEKEDIAKEMKKEHMSQSQILFSEQSHSDKFSKFAWSELPVEDQKRIINAASDEEKKNYKVKTQ